MLSDITGAPTCVFPLSEWVGVSATNIQFYLCACLCSVDAGASAVRKVHLPLQPHCDFLVYDYLYSFSLVNPRSPESDPSGSKY